MPTTIVLPDLGENIESGTILKIFVAEGSKINAQDPILEIETDKAAMEVPSMLTGTIDKIFAREGAEIQIGSPLLSLIEEGTNPEISVEKTQEAAHEQTVRDDENKKIDLLSSSTSEPRELSAEEQDVILPDLGENIESAIIINIPVSVGDRVEQGDVLLELETDKATLEINADRNGELTNIYVAVGSAVVVGAPIVKLKSKAQNKNDQITVEKPMPVTLENSTPSAVPPPEIKTSSHSHLVTSFFDKKSQTKKLVPAAPSIRRFAREIGVIVEDVPGTGPRGRISKDDIKAYSKRLHEQKSKRSSSAQPLPDFSTWGEIKRRPMNKIKDVTASHMAHCWSEIPMVTQFDRADITDLEALRQKHKNAVEQSGNKLTMTAILIKVCSSALKEFSRFNTSIDLDKKEIIFKHYHNIGVAVDTPGGLMVPVIKNVAEKNILDLAQELGELSLKARERRLSPSEMKGGSFTISNLGGIAGSAFTPIVNWPETAILGIARSEMQPVYRDGEFVPRLMMPLCLSYDHRVIDGAEGARFLQYIGQVLEDPFLMNLHG